MSSFTRLISAASVTATVALLAAAPGAWAATSLKKCSLSLTKQQKLGATYVTNVKVAAVTCSTATDVAKAFNRCRKENGPKGRCTHRVLRFSCTDTRPTALQIPTQINGNVKCKNGSRRVNFDFQQNV